MVLPTFAAWAAMYGKVYNGDEVDREAIYNANMEWIRANQDGLSFKLGATKFADLTLDEFKQMLSPMPTVDDRLNLGERAFVGKELPEEIDWSDKGAVTPAKNQGQTSSCWAFSSTGAFEGRAAIATGKLESFSEQQLIDCSGAGTAQGGGLPSKAFEWAAGKKFVGLCTEKSYPYEATDASCREDSCDIAVEASQVTGWESVTPRDKDALAEAVADGPVSVGIEADTKHFQLYESGVFTKDDCGTSLDHGVLVVGFGVEDGVEYWKVKNSWGEDWGENGFIRLEKGKAKAHFWNRDNGQCGILMMPNYPVIGNSAVTV